MFDYKSNCLPELSCSQAAADQSQKWSRLSGEPTNTGKRDITTTNTTRAVQQTTQPVVCHSTSLQRISSHKQSEDSTTTARACKTLAGLPAVSIANSALVHQRASAGDQLAAASAATAVSLPLMIGGRSKCVVNLLERKASPMGQPDTPPTTATPNSTATTNNNPSSVGPQNTAIRAEQRRQNMSISVVRPVVNTTTTTSATTTTGNSDNYTGFSSTTGASRKASLQSELTGRSFNINNSNNYSLVDDWMNFEKSFSLETSTLNESILNELLLSNKLGKVMDLNEALSCELQSHQQYMMKQSEQESRQQAILMRREEYELNRHINRQHLFLVNKLEERKRNLQIIHSVWLQRDFRHAIEKLVDIYHQGLLFASANNASSRGGVESSQLSSMNTSLVVDVVSIVILSPKLWTLEICQLLLPIIINDLLMQTRHEYYVEVALKALKLILTQFSSVIKSTLESMKHSNKLVGVDLSREDRINKCLTCYKHLVEANSILSGRTCRWTARETNGRQQGQMDAGQVSQCKLEAQYRELQSLFGSLRASFDMDPLVVLRRFGGAGGTGSTTG